jgi:Cd2+/Zn2+-exporting ATPase
MMEYFGGRWYEFKPLKLSVIAAILSTAAFILFHSGFIPEIAEIAAFIISIPLASYHWVREGIEKLLRKKIGIELLMISAVFGAVGLKMVDEAAFLAILYGIAESLEEYAFARTRHSIKQLLDLSPKKAIVLNDVERVEKEVRVEEIKPGDIIVVKPGMRIATDGVVVEGRSYVDEAHLTGEALPVEKRAGDEVFAGSICLDGFLKVKATRSFQDNSLSKIVRLVEEAQEAKAQRQLLIERFSSVYTPAIFFIALVLFALSLLSQEMYLAKRGVVLLVASAPCALVISIPVTLVAAIGRAGRRGILIKGGFVLEELEGIRIIAFDKTGTLSEGLEVVEMNVDEEALPYIYSAEKYSQHPVAKAIVEKLNNFEELRVEDFKAIHGFGISAVVDGREVVIRAGNAEMRGKTVVEVEVDGRKAGYIALADRLRDDAIKAISELREMGYEVIMLTGDSRNAAEEIAGKLKIKYIAELSPGDKLKAIDELKKRGKVMMVGDGINDAPALAKADVSVAVGDLDAAIEAADVALTKKDLRKIPYLLRLGKEVSAISRQNLALSVLVLVLMIPSAIAGLITAAIAVVVHEASELLAVANGLRVSRENSAKI